MIYACDFDGTLCEPAWPGIGAPKQTVIDYCKRLKQDGHKLILWTCREGARLQDAVAWCAEHGLTFDAVNQNLPLLIDLYGNDSRKIGADFYIDDKNLFMEGVNNMAEIKDSGERREFSSGAVRDMSEGKGDMYSLPPAALLRLSKHYELGAKKYNRLNYMKGIPVSSFMDSALRHIIKYLDGWDDEDHLAAAAFNVLGAIQMEERNAEMQDVEARKGKQSFGYKTDSVS